MAQATEETPLKCSVDMHPGDDGATTSTTTRDSVTTRADSFFINTSSFSRNAKLATFFMFFTVFLERLGYYNVGNNLTVFAKFGLNFSTNEAVTTSSVFRGTSYFLPLFGGILADSVLGTYPTIYGGLFLELIGMLFFLVLTSISNSITKSTKLGLVFPGLVFISLGQGFIRANIPIFGAEQHGSRGEEKVDTFFRWYYWVIKLSAFFAILPFSLILSGPEGNLKDAIVQLVTIGLALTIYIFGKKTYNIVASEGSTLFQLFRTLCLKRSYREDDELTIESTLPQHGVGIQERQLIRHLVELVKIFGSLMLFITVYTQTESTYIIQASHMNTTMGTVHIARSIMPIFDSIIVLTIVPVVHFFIIPTLKKYDKKPGLLNSIAIGLVFSTASALAAAILEVVRHFYHDRGVILSVFWQIPQFALMGIGEIFTMISGLQFAYLESPKGMKGFVMGLFICSWGLGSYLGILLTWIVNWASGDIWYPDDFNNGHTEYFLFLLSGLSFITFFLVKVFAHGYISINDRVRLINTGQATQHEHLRTTSSTPRHSTYDSSSLSKSSSEDEDPELNEQFNQFLERGRVGGSPPPCP
ncbi:solute carrier family 15 member 4-like [Lineus longissimus]|uniref:solute carrier family 15 member 4-like n=1 Tax=Lineus longissimus TaxID=88925 RepID=UPI002B4CDB75